jgi:hypothetical protein
MPYFIILPAFVLAELILLGALVGTLTIGSLKRFRGALLAVIIWATLGFVVANAIIVAITFGALAVADRTGAGEWAIVKVLLAALFFVGPFAASIGGAAAGALMGLRRAFRASELSNRGHR